METYLDLSKGLHTDFEYISQPQGTYRHLNNAIRELPGSIENERGTVLLKEFAETNRRILGHFVLESDVIIFSYSPTNSLSEIGVLSETDVYTVITNDASLSFNLDIIIRAEGKRNFKGERIIYFVGKGLPMRVLNIDKVPTTNFDDNTKLVLSADMPQVKLVNVVDGGSLPTGVYQFGTRLLTKSTNSTSISLLTNPIPISDDSVNDRDKYDGAPPQTPSNKSINLNITNVDTDYEFIEVIALTYIGTGNVTQVNVVGRLPIQGRTSIPFTYSNLTQIREAIDINGLVVDAVNYDSAEFITQKDGILILGSLTTSIEDYNFQPAANNIPVYYTIKEEVWNENINISNGVDVGTINIVGNDYKNPSTVVEFKSYMRDEVYSIAVTPIFTNWSMGAAYHIPGREDVNTGYNPIMANTITKQLGTYYSSEEYPDGKGYPAFNNLFGKRVRHHRMPTLIQEPHVQTRNSVTYIRMLGIKVDLTSFISTLR